jgi:hypothetical protein
LDYAVCDFGEEMKKELDDALCRDFPLLYIDRHGNPRETVMYAGFCCDDGWEPLIRELSVKLENIIASMPNKERPVAAQVKQKFGELRFYLTLHNTEMEKLIDEAEELSFKTCEKCGKPGEVRSDGYYVYTACDSCNEAKQNKEV